MQGAAYVARYSRHRREMHKKIRNPLVHLVHAITTPFRNFAGVQLNWAYAEVYVYSNESLNVDSYAPVYVMSDRVTASLWFPGEFHEIGIGPLPQSIKIR